jgi:F0F1-type ATP synthase membrane subunit a
MMQIREKPCAATRRMAKITMRASLLPVIAALITLGITPANTRASIFHPSANVPATMGYALIVLMLTMYALAFIVLFGWGIFSYFFWTADNPEPIPASLQAFREGIK